MYLVIWKALFIFAVNKRIMETRIKVVWMLSLLSIMLLVGVQAYWLYNQYRYEADRCLEKMGEEIEAVTDNELELRKRDVSTDLTYIVKRNAKRFCDLEDTVSLSPKNIGFYFSMQAGQADSLTTPPLPFNQFRLTFDTQMREDSLYSAIDRALVDRGAPFRKETLDSLLTESFPEQPFTTVLLGAKDLQYRQNAWNKTGSFFSPALEYAYMYNPLEQGGVMIRMPVRLPALLKAMGAQLVLSVGLIGLLGACFVFQVRTILKQKKLDEMRQRFVHTMVHELKRPVQTLKMCMAFLADQEMRTDSEATGQVVQDSRFELDNLSAYLEKLKDMVRADSDGAPLRPVRFNWRELSEKVVRLTRTEGGKKVDIRLAFRMDSPWVTADPVHLANVLNNLIENAVKYSGEEVRVRIETVAAEKEWRMTVSDDGFGIPVSDQARVFEKFYRGTFPTDRNIPGMGLGLSYVKLIAEAHRGTVSLESTPGKGTSVTLNFPR